MKTERRVKTPRRRKLQPGRQRFLKVSEARQGLATIITQLASGRISPKEANKRTRAICDATPDLSDSD